MAPIKPTRAQKLDEIVAETFEPEALRPEPTPGFTCYSGMLRSMSPLLWESLFCPSGDYHVWATLTWRRKSRCTECGWRR